jgi:hypothetical protein
VTTPVGVVAAVGVRIARAGLGQASADQVGTGDDRDVEPRLAGDELVGPAGIAALDPAALTRIATITPTMAQNSVVLKACLVSVVRRRTMPVWRTESVRAAPDVVASIATCPFL